MMDTTLMFAALVLIAAMGLLYQACLVLSAFAAHHFSTSQSGDRA
jgi:NitT/TauT family transport system permease protein